MFVSVVVDSGYKGVCCAEQVFDFNANRIAVFSSTVASLLTQVVFAHGKASNKIRKTSVVGRRVVVLQQLDESLRKLSGRVVIRQAKRYRR